MKTAEIAIRSIQHYMYCPHRWGLLEIDRAWAENMFVTKANLMHERVHDPGQQYFSRGKRVFTAVPVYNDREEYNLYGVTDCLELKEDEKGIVLDVSGGKRGLAADAEMETGAGDSMDGTGKRYKLCIVEYKPTKPRDRDFREDDLMQVFAQKLCVDYVFGGDCDAAIYYADVKKRVRLPLRENAAAYEAELRELLSQMRGSLEKGQIPAIRKGQKCRGCSMKDLCMPTAKKPGDLHKMIHRIGEDSIGPDTEGVP